METLIYVSNRCLTGETGLAFAVLWIAMPIQMYSSVYDCIVGAGAETRSHHPQKGYRNLQTFVQ